MTKITFLKTMLCDKMMKLINSLQTTKLEKNLYNLRTRKHEKLFWNGNKIRITFGGSLPFVLNPFFWLKLYPFVK
jgi:hypothetical protein